jgi:hypothetical protein
MIVVSMTGIWIFIITVLVFLCIYMAGGKK